MAHPCMLSHESQPPPPGSSSLIMHAWMTISFASMPTHFVGLCVPTSSNSMTWLPAWNCRHCWQHYKQKVAGIVKVKVLSYCHCIVTLHSMHCSTVIAVSLHCGLAIKFNSFELEKVGLPWVAAQIDWYIGTPVQCNTTLVWMNL